MTNFLRTPKRPRGMTQTSTGAMADLITTALSDDERQMNYLENNNIEKPVLGEEEAKKLLEKLGYGNLKKKIAYMPKTFEFEKPILEEFLEIREMLGIRVKDAATEALKLWCASQKTKSLKVQRAKQE